MDLLTSQYTVLVRCINNGFPVIKMVFTQGVENTSADCRQEGIKDGLEEVDTDQINIVCAKFDGAADMTGRFRGVCTKMKEDTTKLIGVHCDAHRLEH